MDGEVIDSATLNSDEEIVDWIRPHLADRPIIAVDAPLIVRNATRQRQAEWLVGKLFGAAGASAHSANLANPSFADGGRGWRLAAALRVEVIPSGPLPYMLEVYPHPAAVALFELDSIIRYKRKRGRSTVQRQGEFHRLLQLMETLHAADPPLDVTTSPRWTYIRQVVADAETHAALGQVEDEIDAYLCAYIGLYWLRWGAERSAILGSLQDGYIASPIDAERRTRLAMLLSESG